MSFVMAIFNFVPVVICLNCSYFCHFSCGCPTEGEINISFPHLVQMSRLMMPPMSKKSLETLFLTLWGSLERAEEAPKLVYMAWVKKEQVILAFFVARGRLAGGFPCARVCGVWTSPTIPVERVPGLFSWLPRCGAKGREKGGVWKRSAARN